MIGITPVVLWRPFLGEIVYTFEKVRTRSIERHACLSNDHFFYAVYPAAGYYFQISFTIPALWWRRRIIYLAIKRIKYSWLKSPWYKTLMQPFNNMDYIPLSMARLVRKMTTKRCIHAPRKLHLFSNVCAKKGKFFKNSHQHKFLWSWGLITQHILQNHSLFT